VATTASTYFNKINVDFPRAGKDNDSQGFRDNFKNIFNAFSATNTDIESLKLNAVTLGGENNFGYNTIRNATLQSCITKLVDYSTSPTSGNIYVNFQESNYQKWTISPGSSTFNITNWPSVGLAQITLSVAPNSTNTTQISFGGNLVTVGSLSLPVVSSSTSVQFFDLWTDDNGVTIYISKKGL
jgi:hypothetical protein